ncbi:MAG: GNAT family N-acetyltransferase [Oscillospiraceae bacterium]|nr:GNAT family N-acetyltransferase [Oscillospiraceae bacterium]
MLELARPEDRSAVEVLAQQVHALHVNWRPDIYELADEMWPRERFAEAVAQRQLFVAKIGDTVAGYVLLKVRNYDMVGHAKRRVLLVDEICVDESQRNQGIGTEMMIEVRAIARAFGCTDMQLGVYPQNNEALAFYQKCGFRIRSIDMQMKL